MKDGDTPNSRVPAQETASSHAGQTIDSENSSGSVYHSPTDVLEGDSVTIRHNTPSNHSESDSTDHFSDAIQESDDTASVYSAEEIPHKDEIAIQVLVSKSSLHQWSATASKASILPNENSPSLIPVPAHTVDLGAAGARASRSFQFERTVENSEGSRIPVPLRLRDALHCQNLRGSQSEPKINSRNSSEDRNQDHQVTFPTRNLEEANPTEDLTAEDIQSSESENITAISIQQQEGAGGLEEIISDDLLGDPEFIPFDNTDIPAHITLPTSPEGVRGSPTAPPLCQDDVRKDKSGAQDDDIVPTLEESEPERSPEPSDKPLPERSPSYTIVSYPSQTLDVSEEEETAVPKENQITPPPVPSSVVPAVGIVETSTIQVVELDRARQAETLPAPPIEYLQVSFGDLAMGQAKAKEAVIVSAEPADCKIGSSTCNKQENEETNSSLKTLPSADDTNDDDYVEIDELAEPSTVKKVTRFGKLKSKLQRRSSNKEVNAKKPGSTVKETTLKVRRKALKTGSRPASAKRPITPPMTSTTASILKPKGASTGVSRFSNIRASIKQDVERMKQTGRLELEAFDKRSSVEVAIGKSEDADPSKVDLREDVTSVHSVRDQESNEDQPVPSSQDVLLEVASSTLKSPKLVKEDNAASAISLPNHTKLSSLKSRYKVQLRKYKSHVADMNDMLGKSKTLHGSLAQMKAQIVSIAGEMPPTLEDLPALTDMVAAVPSENKEMPEQDNSHFEELKMENDNLRTENGRLHSNLNVVLRENKQIKEELATFREQLFISKKQAAELIKANEERLQSMESMKLEIQKAKRVAETYRRKMEEFQKSNHEQKVRNEEEKSRRLENEKALIAEVNSLKNKLHLESSRKECTQNVLNNLSEEKEMLENEIRELKNNIADLHHRLLDQKQVIDKARKDQEEYNQLQVNVNKLRAELEGSQKYCEALASRIDSSEKAEEETSKRLIQLSEELLDKMNLIQQLSEQQRLEHNKRTDLYKIIGNLSSLMGFEIDHQDLEAASDREKCENTQLILKICSDFEKVLRNKDAEIEKQKQHNADLQSLHNEKQTLLEQLYEFVNEKNASIYKRSSLPEAADNKEEEKNVEKSPGMNIVEESDSKEHPDFQELYSMLEVKRHTLLRMESQIRSLQEVHAHCGMRRTMQESRIAELETMLANCLD